MIPIIKGNVHIFDSQNGCFRVVPKWQCAHFLAFLVKFGDLGHWLSLPIEMDLPNAYLRVNEVVFQEGLLLQHVSIKRKLN